MELIDGRQEHRGLERDPEVRILRKLADAGANGLSKEEIGERTKIPARTLSRHLDFLAEAGLIAWDRPGRAVAAGAHRTDFQMFSAVMYHKTFKGSSNQAANAS